MARKIRRQMARNRRGRKGSVYHLHRAEFRDPILDVNGNVIAKHPHGYCGYCGAVMKGARA